ncbi:MAG: hypothetical protein SGJ27_21080 [Candidatus Melainabacteria bacterium]|nr:hypothetical protein [Candidatus Melainabacteria bacterium]
MNPINILKRSRLARVTMVLLAFGCFSEVTAGIAQEYGGNITPPPFRPRRAYSTIDTYNYTHGASDTTYSDSHKKAKRVKRIRKLRQAINRLKSDDTTGKVTTSGSGNGNGNGSGTSSGNSSGGTQRVQNGPNNDARAKSAPGASSGSSKSAKSDANRGRELSSGNDPSSKTAPGVTPETIDITGSTKKNGPKSGRSGDAGVTGATSVTGVTGDSSSVSSESSSKSTGTENRSLVPTSVARGGKDKLSDNLKGAKLSAIPAPQMPPPPTSIGGLDSRIAAPSK